MLKRQEKHTRFSCLFLFLIIFFKKILNAIGEIMAMTLTSQKEWSRIIAELVITN